MAQPGKRDRAAGVPLRDGVCLRFAGIGWQAGGGKIRSATRQPVRRPQGETERHSPAGVCGQGRRRAGTAPHTDRRYAARSDMAFDSVAAVPRQFEHPMLLPTYFLRDSDGRECNPTQGGLLSEISAAFARHCFTCACAAAEPASPKTATRTSARWPRSPASAAFRQASTCPRTRPPRG